VLRVAEVAAPVVLAVERFDDVSDARETLGVPVICV
jgi:hypothetical protein